MFPWYVLTTGVSVIWPTTTTSESYCTSVRVRFRYMPVNPSPVLMPSEAAWPSSLVSTVGLKSLDSFGTEEAP